MRFLLLLSLIAFCHTQSIAQHKPTKEETIKWLQEKMTQERSATGKRTIKHNTTVIFVDVSKYKPGGDFTDKDFNTKIESYVSWKQNEVEIQNDIFKNGKLSETYTYQVPFTAITGTTITNCIRNTTGEVNAYRDRPLSIIVRKNTTKVGHINYDKNGKEITGTKQYRMNNNDGDWDSNIPIAGNWDKDPTLLDKTQKAIARLVELSEKKYTLK